MEEIRYHNYSRSETPLPMNRGDIEDSPQTTFFIDSPFSSDLSNDNLPLLNPDIINPPLFNPEGQNQDLKVSTGILTSQETLEDSYSYYRDSQDDYPCYDSSDSYSYNSRSQTPVPVDSSANGMTEYHTTRLLEERNLKSKHNYSIQI